MKKKGNFMKKIFIMFVIIAIAFGIYSLFFSEKARNINYYIDSKTKLISFNDLERKVGVDGIYDLMKDIKDSLTVDKLNNINRKYGLDSLLSEFISSIVSKEEKYNLYIYEDFLVNFNDNITQEKIEEIESKYGIKLTLNSDTSFSKNEKLYKFNINKKSSEIIKLLNDLTDEDSIEYAQPSYIYSICQLGKGSSENSANSNTSGGGINREKEFPVNDPRYTEQWNFKDIGVNFAWNDAKGEGAVVAVIDTGVKKVEDLDKTEILPGYNFVDKNTNAEDDHGHGSHVAGTIAQSTNNGKGVAGIAFEAKIMPLKVLNKNGFGNITDIAEAIKWAADKGANVINMSLGGGGRTQIMEDAIKYAQKKGVVVVAAAGNESRDRASYPAYYEGVVSVAAYGPEGKPSFYTNYGDGVRISAPGGDDKTGKGEKGKILQDTINGYQWYQGTSMASPHVAGVAALIISSGVKDANKVIDILYKSARKVENDGKNYYGAGKLDAKKAIEMSLNKSTAPDLAIDTTNIFIYAIAIMIALIVFFIWFNKTRTSKLSNSLNFLPFFIGIVLSVFPNLDKMIFGSFTPLFHSALIPLIIVLLFAGSKVMRSLAVAVCIGAATILVVDTFILFSDVLIIPDFTPFYLIDKAFLLINALICLLLGLSTAKNSPSEK